MPASPEGRHPGIQGGVAEGVAGGAGGGVGERDKSDNDGVEKTAKGVTLWSYSYSI